MSAVRLLQVLRAMLSVEKFEEAASVLQSFAVPLLPRTVAAAVIETTREVYNAAASVGSTAIEVLLQLVHFQLDLSSIRWCAGS